MDGDGGDAGGSVPGAEECVPGDAREAAGVPAVVLPGATSQVEIAFSLRCLFVRNECEVVVIGKWERGCCHWKMGERLITASIGVAPRNAIRTRAVVLDTHGTTSLHHSLFISYFGTRNGSLSWVLMLSREICSCMCVFVSSL